MLGHWTSEQCFEEHRRKFVAPNADQRAQILEEIRNADSPEYEKWVAQWLYRLKSYELRLRRMGRSPGDYFEIQAPGLIHQKLYRKRANRQLVQQRLQAASTSFAERYRSGFSFTPVPVLRGNVELYDEFLVSLCESALNSLRKGRLLSQFSKTLRDALASQDVEIMEFTGEELLAYLRDKSKWRAVGEQVTCFHLQTE